MAPIGNADNLKPFLSDEKREHEDETSKEKAATPDEKCSQSQSPLPLLQAPPELNITVLSLSNSNLSILPDQFDNIDNITEVNLSHNKLCSLPKSFVGFKKLRILNLSHNQFTKVPNCLYQGMYLIRELDLSNNQLVEFNLAPLCLSLLKIVDVSFNCLTNLPLWLFNQTPSQLENIDLSNNQKLTVKFDDNFIQKGLDCVCSRVQILKVIECNLTNGTLKFLKYFNNLRSLHVGNRYHLQVNYHENTFSELPVKSTKCFPNLRELHISNTGVPSLLGSLKSFHSLEVLDISHNTINWLPSEIGNLGALRVLNASHCTLFFLPDEFANLTSLQELYLAGNELTALPYDCGSLRNLMILDLYDNKLTEVPDLSLWPNLEGFDISMNDCDLPEIFTVNGVTVPYESLRLFVIKLIPDKIERSALRREIPPEIPFDDQFSSGDSLIFEYPSAEESSTSSTCSDIKTSRQAEDEMWDDDCLSEDSFDPSVAAFSLLCMNRELSPTSEATALMPIQMRQSPNFFLPYKEQLPFWGTHARFSQSEEGQFDDAD